MKFYQHILSKYQQISKKCVDVTPPPPLDTPLGTCIDRELSIFVNPYADTRLNSSSLPRMFYLSIRYKTSLDLLKEDESFNRSLKINLYFPKCYGHV